MSEALHRLAAILPPDRLLTRPKQLTACESAGLRALLLATLVLACAASAPGASHAAEPARAAAPAYVRLADWAQVNGFGVHWLKQDQMIELTNYSSRVELAADSREARINGVHV